VKLIVVRIASRKAAGKVTVRLQWDPHHHLDGTPDKLRRAIQLGLKGVDGFSSGEDILHITDMTAFAHSRDQEKGPREVIYPLSDAIKVILGIPLEGGKGEEGEDFSDEAR
jgi:hypothetical protein